MSYKNIDAKSGFASMKIWKVFEMSESKIGAKLLK